MHAVVLQYMTSIVENATSKLIIKNNLNNVFHEHFKA